MAACGGTDGKEAEPAEPRLPRALAADLAARSDRIADALAAGDDCGAAAQADDFRSAVLAAINQRRVPPELQEELSGAANGLVERIDCTPPPPPPAEPATTAEEWDEGEDEDEEPAATVSEDGSDEPPAETDPLPAITVDELVPTVTDVLTTTETTTTEGG